MKSDSPRAVWIKVCGTTNSEDALAAAELGADALGFVFAPSPRQVSPEAAREIIKTLPPLVQTVGVFVDEDPEKVAYTADSCDLDLLQFHGKETVSYCEGFGRRVIKAVRVQNEDDLESCSEYIGVVEAFLLDTYVAGQYGGTGVTFDWGLARAARRYGRIILAGGLNPDNVAAAIREADPYAVDASSGLEQKPGVKDHAKIARFIQEVRQAEEP
ncbi:MAG: phosphoribosylanthranilate isomerase [Deltaproteobacteria bacterium]|nr:phosphoribosylanthranilate isomerase [Deltaproteobacteria bacterium]